MSKVYGTCGEITTECSIAAMEAIVSDAETVVIDAETNALLAESSAVSAAASAVTAEGSAATSAANANFAGRWSDLTGALSVPSSVLHDDLYWALLDDLADVTSSEPIPLNTNWSQLVVEIPVSGTLDFIASGTLPNGSPVVLKADGTVEVVVDTTITESIPAGAESVFNSGTTSRTSVSFDPNNSGKFVVAYKDGGNASYGTAVVGTVNGTAITFGSEYVFNSGIVYDVSLSFDPNNLGKFVIAYSDQSNAYKGTAIVGIVNGTAITFGSEYVFNSIDTYYSAASFDPNNSGKFVVAYRDTGNASYGTAVVGTVNGTAITFGSEYVFNSGVSNNMSLSFDPNNLGKFVVAYTDYLNANYGTAVVGTVNGTAITFGSEYVFNSGITQLISASFDPNNSGKFVIAYSDQSNANYGTAVVGTVSGTTITFGSEYVFNNGLANYISASFDPNNSGKFVVAYKDTGNASYGTAVVGTVNGTAITFGSEYVFNNGVSNDTSVSFDPNNLGKFVIAYADGSNSYYGTAVVGQVSSISTNLTSTNFLGTSTNSYTDAQTASIMLQGGISDNQTGLTIGSTYYVQPDGTFATTEGTPSVIAGKAVKPTTLLLKGL